MWTASAGKISHFRRFQMKKRQPTDFNTRQYMEPVDFELFYYSDTALSSVAPHYHDYYELYFFLEGDVDYHVEDKLYHLEYGDCLLIPPGTSHHPVFLSRKKPYRRFVFWFRKDYYNKLRSIDQEFTYCFDQAASGRTYRFHADSTATQALQGKLMDLLEELGSSRPFKRQTAELMAVSFLVYVNRIVYDVIHQRAAVYENLLYLNICDYINRHLEEDLSLDSLAAFFYVSKFHISHIFKDNMGISLHQYILKKRLHASKNAILSGQPIGQVYHQYGFKYYTSFFRAFKKEYGASPKEYRSQHRPLAASQSAYPRDPAKPLQEDSQ